MLLMKKKYTYIFALTTQILCYSQGNVGINNTNPQEELHIRGNSSNIRIEGLNEVNNPNNLGTSGTSKVFVNGAGDLVLGEVSDNVQLIFDSENYLNDEQKPGILPLTQFLYWVYPAQDRRCSSRSLHHTRWSRALKSFPILQPLLLISMAADASKTRPNIRRASQPYRMKHLQH